MKLSPRSKTECCVSFSFTPERLTTACPNSGFIVPLVQVSLNDEKHGQ